MKFGVGQPVRRFEDQTLITGKGRYTDDIQLDRMAQAYVLRAQVAHANIRKIDATAARAMPGVLLVLTGAGESFAAGMDLKEYFRELDGKGRYATIKTRRVAYDWQWHRLMWFEKPTIHGQRLVLRRRLLAVGRVRPGHRRR